LAAKVAKAHEGSTLVITVAPKPPASSTLRPPTEKKSTFMGSTSNQPIVDQPVDDKKKGAVDKEVLVDPNDTNKKLHLSTKLDVKLELTLIIFLQENLDVFTWQISDIPRIPRELIEHKLGTDPAFKPIKQNEIRHTPERHEIIQAELNKLLEARFIRLVNYPSWLANPILVEKPDGSWRMCINIQV
jgi:hypothetical protein